jgi:predicted MFS family arabinose efflux permease
MLRQADTRRPRSAWLAGLTPEVLRANADFRLVYVSELTSCLGSAMSAIAYPLLVLSLGGTAVQAGSVATVSLSARLALRLPAGQLADRWNRRTVMLVTDLARVAALGSIPLAAAFGGAGYPQLVAVAVAEGAATALFGPASDILTKDVVSPQCLPAALGLSQSVQAATYLAGPAIGGALFAAGRELPFAVDAGSYAVSALLLWLVTVRPPAQARTPQPPAGETQATGKTQPRGGMLAGIRWLTGMPDLLAVLAYASVINLVSTAIEVLAIIDLRAHGVAAPAVGLILSCSGIGAITGSVASAFLIRHLHPVTILSGIGVLWSASLAVLAAGFSPPLLGILLCLLMTLSPAAGVVVGHAVLVRTPRALLGRVSAATSILLSGLAALGPLFAGALYGVLGSARGFLVLAAVTVAATAASWLPLRRSRLPRPAPSPSVGLAGPTLAGGLDDG